MQSVTLICFLVWLFLEWRHTFMVSLCVNFLPNIWRMKSNKLVLFLSFEYYEFIAGLSCKTCICIANKLWFTHSLNQKLCSLNMRNKRRWFGAHISEILRWFAWLSRQVKARQNTQHSCHFSPTWLVLAKQKSTVKQEDVFSDNWLSFETILEDFSYFHVFKFTRRLVLDNGRMRWF